VVEGLPFPSHLLGRHVPRRAQDGPIRGPDLGEDLLLGRFGERWRLVEARDLREPPVEQVHLAVVPEHHVHGLDVAVDDAVAVRVLRGQTQAAERGQQFAA
jgi:hypothetical protein